MIVNGILLFVGMILFSVSFGSITPLEFGIRYNDVTKKIDESGPWFSGRYFVGLGSRFIKYNNTWNLMELRKSARDCLTPKCNVEAWTREGQAIELDVALYWEFDREKIVDFYYNYGHDEATYMPVLNDIAQRAIKKVCTQFEATDFFDRRPDIGRSFDVELRSAFAEQGLVVQIVSFLGTDLPDQFETTVVRKVVTAQQRQTSLVNQRTNVSLAEIEVIAGQGAAQVQLKLAKAQANATLVIQNAFSDGQKRLRDAETIWYGKMKNDLNAATTPLSDKFFSASQFLKLRAS